MSLPKVFSLWPKSRKSLLILIPKEDNMHTLESANTHVQ